MRIARRFHLRFVAAAGRIAHRPPEAAVCAPTGELLRFVGDSAGSNGRGVDRAFEAC
jgi:hypothetical protein